MIQVIDIPASIYPRKAFKFDNEDEKIQYTNFKVGGRVLPADLFNNEITGVEYYFRSIHSPYEKGHLGTGGISVVCSDGSTRTFYPDSVIIHPSSFTMRNDTTQIEYNGEQMKKRGRKRTKPVDEATGEVVKGKRGRKPLDPEIKAQREAEKSLKLQSNPDRKRGRPKLTDPKVPKEPKVSTGKRGRKPNPQLHQQREEDKSRQTAAKLALGIKTGKGRISDTDHKRIEQWLKNN